MDTAETTQSAAELLERARVARAAITEQIGKRVFGQTHVVDHLLIGLFARGHTLMMGVPGLAKTLLVSTLAEILDLRFSRIQFTPDLMPADITGTDILEDDPETGRRRFVFVPGPIFANLLLADEINRTPPKTQAALLQAMAEGVVTVGGRNYPLEQPFLVFATQNPIEQEGTYPLPEAQLDRFLLHVQVGYPNAEEERSILVLNRNEAKANKRDAFQPPELLSVSSVMQARQEILRLHLAEELEEYIVNIVLATRNPTPVDSSLEGQILYGASPRASIGIDRAARARAWLAGRDYVGPEDIQDVASDVLRHRLVLSFEAEADGVDANSVIERILDGVGVP